MVTFIFRTSGFAHAKKQLYQLTLKIIRYNTIELHLNLGKILVEVKCPYSDFVAAHAIFSVWYYLFIRLGIEKHPRDVMRLSGELDFFIFDVGEDLIFSLFSDGSTPYGCRKWRNEK